MARTNPKSSKPALGKKATATHISVKEQVKQHIELPQAVLAINVAKLSKKEEIPEVAVQWDQDYAFHLAAFNISFVTSRGEKYTRGIKNIKIDGKFDEGGQISIIDVLPKTSWVPKDYSTEVSFSLDPFGLISKVTESPAGVAAGLVFKYSWNPKAARVISSGAHNGVHWYSERAGDEYLDGNYQVAVMFSHPKSVAGSFKLTLTLAVHHDIAGGSDRYTEVEKGLEIKTNV